VTLTAKDVAEITRLLEESNFDELYLELDGLKLSLRRGSAGAAQPLGNSDGPAYAAQSPGAGSVAPRAAPTGSLAPSICAPGVSTSADGAARPGGPAAALARAADDPNNVPVSAPLLGTFYRAPKPGAPPFVEIGSQVEEDTIIGIIEVMKLMNTVRAGVRGKVTQILCRDGALVEYGETLMRVGKPG
jgi:acetyl-CoA carboxylase biotin carboxyl carrier protein